MRIDHHTRIRNRRPLRPRCLLAVLAATVVASGSLAATAGASGQPFVAGGGKQLHNGIGPGSFAFGISAHGVGADATGTVTSASPSEGFPLQIRVSCLMVFGNDAIVTGRVTMPRDLAGMVVVYEAVDNGNPVGGASPDLFRGSFEPFICPVDETGACFAPVLAPVPIIRGNIIVSADG
jgi:hypothetical protein